MSKVDINSLTSLVSDASAVEKLNENFTNIQDAIENTLSRDGTAPNTLDANLDMNSQKIVNLPIATTDTEPVRYKEFQEIVDGISDAASGLPGAGVAIGGASGSILKKASGVDYATAWETVTQALVGASVSVTGEVTPRLLADALVLASSAEAVTGTNALKLVTPDTLNDAAVYGDYTPSASNTYVHTLYEDLEWDRVDTQRFLNATQRSDPIANDCWQALQNMADWLRDQQPTGYSPYKTMRLGHRTYTLSQALVITGANDSGMRKGRILLTDGSLVAAGSWADQTAYPLPLLEFGQYSQGCGMTRVYINCNGICSGVLVNTTATGVTKIYLEDSRIVNFTNPQFPLQADLYSNTNGNGHSTAPATRYEIVKKHPYGVRIGTKDTTVGTASSSTCKLSGLDIHQWEFNRTESTSFKKRTGIGIWVAAADTYLVGKTNNCADVLKGAIIEGTNNIIKDYHCSPSGGSGEYDASDGPTSDVLIIGTENRGNGANVYHGCYHERILWLDSKRANITGCLFPRATSSTDGNEAAIYLDATSAAENISGGRLNINDTKVQNTLAAVAFRESGFSFLAKPATTASVMAGVSTITGATNSVKFSNEAVSLVNVDGNADSHLLYSATTRASTVYQGTGSHAIRVGNSSDQFEVRYDNTIIGLADDTLWNFRTTAGAKTALQNGGVEFLSTGNKGTLLGGLSPAGGFSTFARLMHTGNIAPIAATPGTDTTPVTTEVYFAEVFIPSNTTITGIAIYNGSATAGNLRVALYTSAGAEVGHSAGVAQSGTEGYQRVPLSASYAAVGPASYFVALNVSNTGGKFRSHLIGNFATTKQTGQVAGTWTTLTVPTTFTASLGPIASLY